METNVIYYGELSTAQIIAYDDSWHWTIEAEKTLLKKGRIRKK